MEKKEIFANAVVSALSVKLNGYEVSDRSNYEEINKSILKNHSDGTHNDFEFEFIVSNEKVRFTFEFDPICPQMFLRKYEGNIESGTDREAGIICNAQEVLESTMRKVFDDTDIYIDNPIIRLGGDNGTYERCDI